MLPNFDVAHIRNAKRGVSQRILTTQRASLIQYIKHNEPVGALVARDFSPRGNNGVYSNVTLGQNGIGDGNRSGLYNGLNSFTNLYSAALNGDFNGAELTLIAWVNITEAVWLDASFDYIVRYRVDAANQLYMAKSSNLPQFVMTSGGTTKTFNITATDRDGTWIAFGLTVSEADDKAIAYMRGEQDGATQTGLGTFAGNLNSSTTLLGSSATTPANVLNGLIAHHALWSTPLSPTDMRYVMTGARI